MSEPDDSQPADGGSGGFLALIEQFDWLKIPGAVRAIAHFVTGIADAGTAWVDIAKAKGQEHAQKIRDRTAARKSIMATTARAAGVQAAQSPERLDRMIDRLVAEELKRQENREAIAIEAGGLLDEVPPPPDTKGPSEDWLNVFSSYAEKATSEQLRQHWAQILAQEIRAPGSFSPATLLMLSIVDARYAAAITRARRWVADDWLPLLGQLGASPHYDDVLVLDSIGFLRVGSAKIFRPVGHDPVVTPFVHTGIATYANPQSPEAQYTMPGALLTIAGKEMLQIMPAEEDHEIIHHIAMRMKEMGFGRVQIGTLKRENGRVRLENATDVES
jgi:Protein of unknown function (DUF2806)